MNLKSWHIYLFATVATAIVVTLLQWSMGLQFGDPDGYYHVGIAQAWQQGMIGEYFPWLQGTILKDSFADQHFLLHILLIPFDSIYLAKIFIVLAAVFCVLGFTFLLRTLEIRWIPLWILLLLLISPEFLFRLNLLKAEVLALGLLFMALVAYTKRNILLLGCTAFLLSLLYSGGALALVAILFIVCVFESVRLRTLVWKPFVITLVAMAIGIVLHPQQHQLFQVVGNQLSVLLGSATGVRSGVEWQAYTATEFLHNAGALLAVLVLAWHRYIGHKMRTIYRSTNGTYILLFALVGTATLAATLLSRRFLAYSVPFTILFAAAVFSDALAQLTVRKLKIVVHHWETRVALTTVVVIIAGFGVFSVRNTAQTLAAAEEPIKYQAASRWFANNTAPQSVVFNTRFDEFPFLFYYNRQNYYVSGLDPVFLYQKHRDHYWTWRKISSDIISEVDPYSFLTTTFNADWIFVDKNRNPNLFFFFETHGYETNDIELRYEDEDTAIFAVR